MVQNNKITYLEPSLDDYFTGNNSLLSEGKKGKLCIRKSAKHIAALNKKEKKYNLK